MAQTKIAVLWEEASLGLYGNRGFPELYKAFGANSGNLAFVHAIRSHLVGEIDVLGWSARPERFAEHDIIVVPCANQLGPHVELGELAEHWAKFGKPMVAIGLGAQAPGFDQDVEVSPGTLNWVRVMAARAPGSAANIWTRGPYTTRQLDKLGIAGSTVGGCPTHFINPAADLGQRIWRAWNAQPLPRAVTVAAGHESWLHITTIEHQLIGLMQDVIHDGQYVVQSAEGMIRIARDEFDDIPPASLDGIRRYVAPHLSEDEFRVWCRRYARAYYDIPAWMQSLRRCDLTIGPRYHGVALALQAERMGATVAIDSRTEEMCVQTGVPFLRAHDLAGKTITRATLRQQIVFDPDDYDAQRAERAGAYVAFLEANGLQPQDFLKRIAGGI